MRQKCVFLFNVCRHLVLSVYVMLSTDSFTFNSVVLLQLGIEIDTNLKHNIVLFGWLSHGDFLLIFEAFIINMIRIFLFPVDYFFLYSVDYFASFRSSGSRPCRSVLAPVSRPWPSWSRPPPSKWRGWPSTAPRPWTGFRDGWARRARRWSSFTASSRYSRELLDCFRKF